MRLGAEFRLRGFVKSELFTQAAGRGDGSAPASAGCLCGFEAANERILENINKRATLADNDRCVALAKNAGLKIKALMSCGHPGESEETVADIRDWLIRNEVDDFDCTVITTYPGTPYYDLAVPHATQAGCVDLHPSQDRRPAARLRGRLHGLRRLLQRRPERRLSARSSSPTI